MGGPKMRLSKCFIASIISIVFVYSCFSFVLADDNSGDSSVWGSSFNSSGQKVFDYQLQDDESLYVKCYKSFIDLKKINYETLKKAKSISIDITALGEEHDNFDVMGPYNDSSLLEVEFSSIDIICGNKKDFVEVAFNDFYHIGSFNIPKGMQIQYLELETVGLGSLDFLNKSTIENFWLLNPWDDSHMEPKSTIEEVVIPKTMKSCNITDHSLKKAKITSPDTMFCFEQCWSLEEVSIPYGVKEIQPKAFSSCYSLEKIELPDTVNTIYEFAFYSTIIESIVIPSGVTKLDEYTFSECLSLKSITIPKSIKTIDETAFSFFDGPDWYYMTSDLDVYYEGTKDDWNNIKVTKKQTGLPSEQPKDIPSDMTLKDIFGEATIHFNSTVSTPTPTPSIKPTVKPTATPTPASKPKSTWVQEGGKWYYYDSNSKKATGWIKDGKSWYYCDKNGVMQTGWIQDGKTWYYMSASGAMVANGWVQSGNTWYYLGSSGAMATNCWVKSGNTWYYISASGVMVTNGWVKSGNIWYYMNASGAMVTNGWVKSGNAWYYFNANGAMVTGELVIDGRKSKFSSSGAWLGYA